jgi:hypothetical protein
MAAAICEPLNSIGEIDVGRVLEGHSALVGVGEEEDGRIECRHFGARRDRGEAGQQGAKERAREGDAPIGCLARGNAMKNSVRLFAQGAVGRDSGV